nr:uncharacterized protein LOC107128847 [Macaca fascicularis]
MILVLAITCPLKFHVNFDPVAFPSTQSNSSSGEDPETSLAQQDPEHHPHDPVASPSTQSTSSSGADPETSLAQQAFQYQPVAFLFLLLLLLLLFVPPTLFWNKRTKQSTIRPQILPSGVHNIFPLSIEVSTTLLLLKQAHGIEQNSLLLASAPASLLSRKPESFNQVPQHDPVASPSTQSTSSSGEDPETSLAPEAPEHHPVAFSTQSTSSSDGDPEMSLTQQQPSQEASVIHAGQPEALTNQSRQQEAGGARRCTSILLKCFCLCPPQKRRN